ncbi:MAG TPA: Mrp/NBP35 family ATP-binding protein [Dehalococcoidia bacterium]|nr:Mrp/NBP35 family ATP-binding protein [Dehalococcoidia bacterium]
MTTKKQIEQELIEVLVPGIGRNIVQLNMIRGIEVINDMVKITLANTALSSSAQDWVRTKTKAVVEGLREVNNVEVEFIECKLTELNQINHVIAVMSGKGGVGKSLIASLMAVALNHQGNEVGILDADITGPSIPKMFGLSTRPGGSDTGILPVVTRSGIEIISINLLLPQEDDAVIWRGPLISKAITQFWEEVVWGRLDYLVVDLPPGTADASLTVMQTLPISGVIIVFTPQDLTAMVVRKAVNMLQKMEKTILGVVENMSYLYIPEIDKRIELFGKSRGEEMAQVANAPFLGQLPIDPELARLCDEGTIESYHSDAFVALSQAFVQALPKTKIEQ